MMLVLVSNPVVLILVSNPMLLVLVLNHVVLILQWSLTHDVGTGLEPRGLDTGLEPVVMILASNSVMLI